MSTDATHPLPLLPRPGAGPGAAPPLGAAAGAPSGDGPAATGDGPAATGDGPAATGDGPELTIDQLAATVGMTVRTVRSYTTRGLLPPPRLRGRTGLYGREHLARLSAIREMLDAGYTLAAAEEILASAPPGLTGPGLDVFRALVNPWQPEEPEIVSRAVLAARMGVPLDEDRLARLARLGLVTALPDGRLQLPAPMLLRAGLQLAALGIDADRVLDTQEELARHARAMADLCVQLFRETVWRAFVDAGSPDEGWPAIRDAVERALPVSSQAVLITFRLALADAIATALAQGSPDRAAAPTSASPADPSPGAASPADPSPGHPR